MRNVLGFCTITVAMLVAGCNYINGSGNVITESREVSGFTAVSLSGSGQLRIDQTGTESLTITTDDNLLAYLKSEVRGNELVLGSEGLVGVNPSKGIIYTLTVKDLKEIGVSGSGAVDAKGIETDGLIVGVSGSGQINVSGIVDRQEIGISGSGDYRAGELKSKVVTISVSGSGGAIVAASDTLDAVVSGSGSIEYIGDPVVTQNISGSGSVRKR